MSSESPAVADARRKADQARAELMASVEDLLDYGKRMKDSLTPSHLAHGAWEATKSKTVDVAEDAIDAVRKRPVAASSAVAALALFIAREPLMDLAGKLMCSKGKTKPAKPGKTKAKAKARRKKVEKVDE